MPHTTHAQGVGTGSVGEDAPWAASRPGCVARFLRVAAWACLAGMLGLWALLHFGGDRWWPATVALYAPLWWLWIPLALLGVGLLLARARRRSWIALGAAGLVLLFPVLRFALPLGRASGTDGGQLVVLTCNLGGGLDPDALRRVLERTKPDAACFQEAPEGLEGALPGPWSVTRQGDLVVATRQPHEEVGTVLRQHPPTRWPRPICVVVRLDLGHARIHLATLHVESPRYGLAEITDARTLLAPSRRGTLVKQTHDRRLESRQVQGVLASIPRPLVIAGDFNMPTSSTIYRECWGEYGNAFSRAGFGLGHTATVEQGGLHFSSRIDHVLFDASWGVRETEIAGGVGSDHLPLVATLVLGESARPDSGYTGRGGSR